MSEFVVVKKGKIESHRLKRNGHSVSLIAIEFNRQDKLYQKNPAMSMNTIAPYLHIFRIKIVNQLFAMDQDIVNSRL